EDWPDRLPTAQALYQFVSDVAAVKVGKHEHVGVTGGTRARRLAHRHVGDQRCVGLKLPVEREIGLPPREALERLPHALHARSRRTALRAVGEERDDRLVAHDAATIARSRYSRIGELLRGGDRKSTRLNSSHVS